MMKKLYRYSGCMALAVAVLLAWTPWLTVHSEEAVRTGLARSLTAFGVVRGISGLIALVESIQVSGSLVLISGSVGVGEVLKPLGELAGHLSDMLLLASASFGLQLVLLKIGTHHLVSAALTICAVAFVVCSWRDGGAGRGWLRTLMIAMLAVRFAVPVVVLANEAIYKAFLQDSDRVAYTSLERSDVKSEREGGRLSLSSFKETYDKAKQSMDNLLNSAGSLTANMTHLISSFVLQALVMPIIFLFAFLGGLKLLYASAVAPTKR